MLKINPLELLEKQYSLLMLQYLHLTPNGRNFEQICSSIAEAPPSKIRERLQSLIDLGLVVRFTSKEVFEDLYVLSTRGRYASEIVWDLFRILLNPSENDDDNDLLKFYK